MDNLNIPSYNHLFLKQNSIRAIQELYEFTNKYKGEVDDSFEELFVDPDKLFDNTISVEQKKQAALMQVLMLEQMYGYTTTTIDSPEYTALILDAEDKILAGKKVNGTLVLFGVEYSS